ncbi:zinc finger protein 726-like isoform X2 [Uranotaenia lowii]|uniref:zinc finger protein 726-like isoform X2 n=1 Tax=Uranotaenia lowii TaxID=190385 RepID=UPI00247A0703|nr:zinc finger protein 726-like isoform X2 [Uranotaenia lowii]XP_055586051.1 zinc finger protein 726-like isoform X2 [Uranotaenia lowii]
MSLNVGKNQPSSEAEETGTCKTHQCLLCGKCFVYASSLTRHLEIHHRKKNEFRCYTCDATFSKKRQLEDHCSLKHIGRPRYACETCGTNFFRYHSYRFHIRNKHPEEYARLLAAYGVAGKIPSKELYSMNGCVYLGNSTSLDSNVGGSQKNPVKLACTQCDKAYAKRGLLEDHYVSKHRGTCRYECEFCGKEFIWRDTYLKHRMVMHPVEYTNLVTQNPAHEISYKSLNPDNGYLERVNDSIGKMSCLMCNIMFTESADVDQHMVSHHSLGANYTCERCNESFANGMHLQNHLTERHVGEPWFECESCGKQLYSKMDFCMHYEREHPEEYDELMQANVCNQLHDIDDCVVVERVSIVDQLADT